MIGHRQVRRYTWWVLVQFALPVLMFQVEDQPGIRIRIVGECPSTVPVSSVLLPILLGHSVGTYGLSRSHILGSRGWTTGETMHSLSRCQIVACRAGRAVACSPVHIGHRTYQPISQQQASPLNCHSSSGVGEWQRKGSSRRRLWALKEGTMAGGGVSEAKRSISHVIFDMDGLLLNTEHYYTAVQQEIAAKYGKKFDWSVKAKLMGMKAHEAVARLVVELGLEGVVKPEDFYAEQVRMLDELFPSVDLLPGVERFIRHLHSHGVPIAVATSSNRRHFNVKTSRHSDVFKLMHHVVTGDDPAVKNGKPAPDIFLVAFERFHEPQLTTEHVLVFEDAPGGVDAAIAAKMHVVMVPDDNLDRKYCQRADQVLSSLLDFDPGYWGLPPF